MNVSDATSLSQTSAKSGPYPKFKNDLGVGEIRIGAREFKCVGASPPHDHPHVYIDIGDDEAILCPYCATQFRHDPRLALFEADPPECRFVELETTPPATERDGRAIAATAASTMHASS